jgi:hypothetical protein
MVRRGSTVRVRQRASKKAPKRATPPAEEAPFPFVSQSMPFVARSGKAIVVWGITLCNDLSLDLFGYAVLQRL